MNRLFSILPRGVIAFLAIAGGIAFIIMSEPPHTICDAQMEVFQKSQGKFLFLDPKKKAIQTTQYQTLRDHCKATNNPGGCYELFQELKIMNRDLQSVPTQCASTIGEVPAVKRAIWESLDLLIRLGWGEKPPTTYYQKFGWLDQADTALYCTLKARAIEFYGESAFEKFREKMLKELPGAAQLSRTQTWDMTLFSENCSRYP